jgi:hypothetical protein
MGSGGSKSKRPSETAVKPFADVQHLTPTRERELHAGATSFRSGGEAERSEKSGERTAAGSTSANVNHREEAESSKIHRPPRVETPMDDLFEEFDEPSPPSIDRRKNRFEIERSVEASPLARSDFKNTPRAKTIESEAPVLPPKQFLRTFDFDNDIFRSANSSKRLDAAKPASRIGTGGTRMRGSSDTTSPFVQRRTLLSARRREEEKRPVSGPREAVSLLGGEEEDLMESILADIDAV